ncbi:hypothetical protein A9404_10005 [Halothiobacillus diazotrophicus]|uniref:TNase-like domain-containing protein n=1 Tax=Halothiobacillus diazotrophicus TaxID=1860122 RepID=A0A191ZII9_9GAMM|nr:hypothetical protein A9404_10005 [Halothiobacillus diazotrophicus]
MLGSWLISSPVWAALVACPEDRSGHPATVAYVDDGDTVRLTTGERVRLAGIDAPEVAHGAYDRKPATADEPFGAASRQALRAMLARSHNRILLRYGRESTDRYGRRLAYLYLSDGESIQANLVAQGMAMAVYMPPNLDLADCLTLTERAAARNRVGIWSLAEYAPGIDTATGVPSDVQGAAIIRGRVLSVHKSTRTVWVNLEGRVALQISRRAWPQFQGVDFHAWRGKTLRARGWLIRDKNRYQDWRMPIESPRAIEVLSR